MASPCDLVFGHERKKMLVKEAVCLCDPVFRGVSAGGTHLPYQRLFTLRAQWNLLGELLKKYKFLG